MTTITITDLMCDYRPVSGIGWGIQFEWLRRERASDVMRLLHLIKRDGILSPITLDHDGHVVDGHRRVYVAFLLGIRDIPAEFA